ncbi:MAG: dockerin type I repeat-containing protein [Clostridia bacterium]|nr:dockerin type I repeat-containing protein [Clostridia bacterium]
MKFSKNIISILLILMLLISVSAVGFSVSADTTAVTAVAGDTDSDGRLSVRDATLIQKVLADLATMDEYEWSLADTDCDGTVTVRDATTIQKVLAGIIDVLPSDKKSILDAKQPWQENQNLYTVDNDAVSSVSSTKLYRFKDNLLTVSTTYDSESYTYLNKLQLISVKTGEVISTQTFETYEVTLQILDDYVAVYAYYSDKLYVLGNDLSIIGEYSIMGTEVFLSDDATTAYVIQFGDMSIVDLKTGDEIGKFDYAKDVMTSGCTEGFVSLTYIDADTLLKETAMLNLNTGELTKHDTAVPCKNMKYGNGVWLSWVCNDDMTYLIEDSTSKSVFYLDESSYVFLANKSGHITEISYTESDEPQVTAYNSQGEFLSACVLSDIEWLGFDSEPVWYEEYNGYFMTLTCGDGVNRLFFWDLSGELSGEDLTLHDTDVLKRKVVPGTEVSQELYARAQELSEKYGVTILIADQCDDTIQKYIISQRPADDESVAMALDTLDEALSRYPENFISQLFHDTYRSMEIQLFPGDISHSSMVSGISGFILYNGNGTITMGLDARNPEIAYQPLEQVIFHEFSHVIDSKMGLCSGFNDDVLYSEEAWLELNPEGFEYSGDGDAVPGYSDKYKDYFVDDYSCTDSGEDRARVMEYAMMAALYPDRIANYFTEETFVEYFQNRAGIQAKLEFYSNSMRDCFDTTGWPEETLYDAVMSKIQ